MELGLEPQYSNLGHGHPVQGSNVCVKQVRTSSFHFIRLPLPISRVEKLNLIELGIIFRLKSSAHPSEVDAYILNFEYQALVLC